MSDVFGCFVFWTRTGPYNAIECYKMLETWAQVKWISNSHKKNMFRIPTSTIQWDDGYYCLGGKTWLICGPKEAQTIQYTLLGARREVPKDRPGPKRGKSDIFFSFFFFAKMVKNGQTKS